MLENNDLGDWGQAAGLLAVKPTGDEMPYGTRQKATEEPDNQGFQHNQSFGERAFAVANEKSPIDFLWGYEKPHRPHTAEGGVISMTVA